MQKKRRQPLKLFVPCSEFYESKWKSDMNRIFIVSFVACSVLGTGISFANFKLAEFTFLPNKSKKVLEVKTTVRDSLKKDRSQENLDRDFKLSDKEIEKLIGNITLNK